MDRGLERIEGENLSLRLVTLDDAGYLYALRTDPIYSRYISPVTGGVADQRTWILRYKEREAAGKELYYVIERIEGRPCGTVRLYEIDGGQFTWGSWILDGSKPPKAAVESAVMSFGVGFRLLGLERALLDVRRANERAVAFYRRFGMRETAHDTDNMCFEYTSLDFLETLDHLDETLGAPGGTGPLWPSWIRPK